MAVDETSLERIRKATFPASRRGYDKREVEKFLNRLADWLETGGGDQARSDTVRRELERVGERTGAILSQAEESAQQIRAEAEQEATQLRSEVAAEAEQARNEADAYAAEARAAADGYSKEARAEADTYAGETRQGADQSAAEIREQPEQDAADAIAAAEAQAARTVEEGVTRRRDIEAVISDLASRRDLAIGELESLGAALEAAIGDHKPSGSDPFVAPDELDPMARADAGAEGEGEETAAVRLDEEPAGREEERMGVFDDLDQELESAEAETEVAAETEEDGDEAEFTKPSWRRGRPASEDKH